ncbi:MAG: hypothetical protein HYU66_14260, partial [Armatimonadetes bacterium]|nr:hypothetical protein [Armatimonadota bacterium]
QAGDLLAGLLACPDSEAVRLLGSFNVTRTDLHARLPEPPEEELSEFRWDETVREALLTAEQAAHEAHLTFLGTPHLIVGLVRSGCLATVALLRQHGANLVQLSQVLLEGVGCGTAVDGNGQSRKTLTLTPRCEAIFRRSNELARDAPGGVIREVHLLRAILEDQSGFSAEVLRRLVADPALLLATLKAGLDDGSQP